MSTIFRVHATRVEGTIIEVRVYIVHPHQFQFYDSRSFALQLLWDATPTRARARTPLTQVPAEHSRHADRDDPRRPHDSNVCQHTAREQHDVFGQVERGAHTTSSAATPGCWSRRRRESNPSPYATPSLKLVSTQGAMPASLDCPEARRRRCSASRASFARRRSGQ